MKSRAFSVDGLPYKILDSERPPVVLLGDLSLVRALARAKLPVILVSADPNDLAIRSREIAACCVVPGIVGPDFAQGAEALADLGASLQRALGRKVPLFYSSDKHLELIYQHRRAIDEAFLCLLNEEDTAQALHDKALFSALCERAGILAPRTLRSGEDIALHLHELREPLLVKPKRKTSWKAIQRDLFGGAGKARVFATRAALLAEPGFGIHANEVLVQELIRGDDQSLVSFHGFCDERARLLASYCGRKIRTYPKFAGESSFIELVNDPDVDTTGREIVGKLGLRGPFKIDLIRDADTGKLYVLEINARFNLWNHLGALHGVNLPGIAYDYLVYGRTPARTPSYDPHYRWQNLYADYCAFRERRAQGELTLGRWLASIADPAVVHEVFAWHDPLPFLQWASSFIRAKLA